MRRFQAFCIDLLRWPIFGQAGAICLILLSYSLTGREHQRRAPASELFSRGITQTSQIEPEKISLSFEKLSPSFVIQNRGPGSFIPNDEVESVPYKQTIWLQHVFVEDNAGVMNSIKNDFTQWEDEEEYARNWNLKSTGLYETPDQNAKKAHFNRKLLKYADKRLAGEVREAEEGSTLARVGRVQKALRPNTEARISQNIKIKFKARVLQGKAMVYIHNPLAQIDTTVDAKGRIDVEANRDIASLGIKAGAEYQANDGIWMARVDRQLTEKITARVSSTQSDKEMAFDKNADKRIEFFFSHSF